MARSIQQAMTDFLAEAETLSSRVDYEEAVGLVVLIGDPETERMQIIGPFPKDTAEAYEHAARIEAKLNDPMNSDGVDVLVWVELLYAPS